MEQDKKVFIPIVFAHGNTETALQWQPLMDRFKKQGYNDLFAISFSPPANGSCVMYAGQLDEFIKTKVLPNIPAGQKIAIMAHSLGVTTTRYYIKSLGGHKHISHAIFIAGANKGIPACDTVLLSDPESKIFKQAPETHTGNPEFLTKLNRYEENEGAVKYLTISSPHDHYFSMWEESPTIEWADNRIIPFKGHWGVRDSDESFEVFLAFLQGRADSLPIGKGVYPHPDRPFGEWGLCSDIAKGQKYIFEPDGKVTFTDGKTTKEGKYVFSTNRPANWIDLIFPEGTYYGMYRLNANADNFALKLGDINGSRPKSFRYYEIYYRIPKKEEIPKEVVGKWKANNFGHLKGYATTEYIATFTSEGTFKIEGKMIIAPQFAIEGKYALEKSAGIYKIHLFVESSNAFVWPRNLYMGGVMEIKDGKTMILNHPTTSKGTCRPQVIDHPVVMDRIE